MPREQALLCVEEVTGLSLSLLQGGGLRELSTPGSSEGAAGREAGAAAGASGVVGQHAVPVALAVRLLRAFCSLRPPKGCDLAGAFAWARARQAKPS